VTRAVHICVFSGGLDELTKRQQGNARTVLAHLDRVGRFSVFEATANQVIAKMMDWLADKKLIAVDNESMGFPWLKVALTDAGRALLAPAASPPVEPGTPPGEGGR
jgi:hypothetical protein